MNDLRDADFTLVYYYEEDDKNFISEYTRIQVFYKNNLLREFDNYYHDKNQATAFIEGFAEGKGIDVSKNLCGVVIKRKTESYN